MSIDQLLSDVAAELEFARAKHGPMHSGHEGYAVILEELDELWEEVRKRKSDPELMRKEAIQVAAMAMRFVLDVCGPQTVQRRDLGRAIDPRVQKFAPEVKP